jgi:hypothetical protein
MAEVVWSDVTREEMLEVQRKADARDQPGSLFMGERILMYHDWMGTDNRWHGVAVLADGTRVVLRQRE